MTEYKKIYITFFNFTPEDFISCESCGGKAVDVHHIDNKGMGGSDQKNFIENLVALCRSCHDLCHDSEVFNKGVRIIHLQNICYILDTT